MFVHVLSTLIIVTFEKLLNFINRISLRLKSYVSINVKGSGHLTVPEPLLDDFWVNTARQQYCCVSVSERVVGNAFAKY